MNASITYTGPTHSRAGQAAIELVLGILMIIILFAGSLQYLKVAEAQRSMVTSLRGEAGARALTLGATVDMANYLLTWDNGADGIMYTADDQPVESLAFMLPNIVNRSVQNADDWAYVAALPNPTPIFGLHENPLPMLELSLVNAEDSEDVPVEESVQNLIYGRDHVRVKHSVWMPVMKGPPNPDSDDPLIGGFL
jgi:hypothetical protein